MKKGLPSFLLASSLSLQGCALGILVPLVMDNEIDYIYPGNPEYEEKCKIYVHEREEENLAQYLRENYQEEVIRCMPLNVTIVRFGESMINNLYFYREESLEDFSSQ